MPFAYPLHCLEEGRPQLSIHTVLTWQGERAHKSIGLSGGCFPENHSNSVARLLLNAQRPILRKLPKLVPILIGGILEAPCSFFNSTGAWYSGRQPVHWGRAGAVLKPQRQLIWVAPGTPRLWASKDWRCWPGLATSRKNLNDRSSLL